MRELLSSLLIAIFLVCPALCGADAIGHVADGHADLGGQAPEPAPDHCPPDGDDACICQGAVTLDSVRIDSGALDLDGPSPFLPAIPPDPAAAHLLARPTTEARSPLATLGDALRVRSYLQNFRC